MKEHNARILAQGELRSNDTRQTGINNNDLIIGPSGAGKTRSYVKPNIMQCNGSMIVADTKGDLMGELGDLLRQNGYQVIHMDFTNPLHSDGYNPLDYVAFDTETGTYSQQDIMTLCTALVPIEHRNDPYWERSARNLLAALVGYVLEYLPEEEHTLEYVIRLFTTTCSAPVPSMPTVRIYQPLLEELAEENPNCFACRQYQLYSTVRDSSRTESCILSFLAEKLAPLSHDGPVHMYRNPKQIRFERLGQEKTAVFLHISDTDRSMDSLVNVFYTQALHVLCRTADCNFMEHRLPVPVRIFFDDFATNARIPDFDNIISVIRSREIYASIILQSITQLNAIYGRERAMTIINNCDSCLYLGGQDLETAQYIAQKANKTVDSILNMPLSRAYLFTRGQKPREVQKFDLKTHPAYADSREGQQVAVRAVRPAAVLAMEVKNDAIS